MQDYLSSFLGRHGNPFNKLRASSSSNGRDGSRFVSSPSFCTISGFEISPLFNGSRDLINLSINVGFDELFGLKSSVIYGLCSSKACLITSRGASPFFSGSA